jgi:hypothetical protein
MPAGGRVDRRAAGKRHRDRVDREVTQPQIDLDRPAAQAGDVDLPVPVVVDDPPGVEIAGELERVAADLGGEAARRRRDVAGEGDVDVDDVAAEDCVTDRSADDPGAVGDVAEPGAGHLDGRSGTEPLLEPRQVDGARHPLSPGRPAGPGR